MVWPLLEIAGGGGGREGGGEGGGGREGGGEAAGVDCVSRQVVESWGVKAGTCARELLVFS